MVGNSYNLEERCLAAGYENGDVKVFDLRVMKLVFEDNLGNGICGIEFDRKDIRMNKLVAAGLEDELRVYDLRSKSKGTSGHGCAWAGKRHHSRDRTKPPTKRGNTIWWVRHLPQNRDVFMSCGGNGLLELYKYEYPPQRLIVNPETKEQEGVPGNLVKLNDGIVATQPVASFDWHLVKLGLCAMVSFDQNLRVGVVTRLSNV